MQPKDTIYTYYGPKKQKGEVGIEIECEGNGRLFEAAAAHWTSREDGSLRGRGIEWVLLSPVARSEVEQVLAELTQSIRDVEAVPKPSDRCGVHIHVNCQEMVFDQVMAFILLYLIFEDALVKWCGEDREGNLFCLRAQDAEAVIPSLRESQQFGHFDNMANDNFRYASVNLAALPKFGSLEFRALRTPEDFRTIKTWVDLLLRIKDASSRFKNFHEIVETLSANGERPFLDAVLGELVPTIDFIGIEKSLRDGVRRVQEIAYTPRFKLVNSAPGQKSKKFAPPPRERRHRFRHDGHEWRAFDQEGYYANPVEVIHVEAFEEDEEDEEDRLERMERDARDQAQPDQPFDHYVDELLRRNRH